MTAPSSMFMRLLGKWTAAWKQCQCMLVAFHSIGRPMKLVMQKPTLGEWYGLTIVGLFIFFTLLYIL